MPLGEDPLPVTISLLQFTSQMTRAGMAGEQSGWTQWMLEPEDQDLHLALPLSGRVAWEWTLTIRSAEKC